MFQNSLLVEPLSKLFVLTDLIHDYENQWEWITGTCSEFKSKINVSREHDWEKGKHKKPLIFRFEYGGLNKHKIINNIGKILVKEFNSEVNYGKIQISSNEKYEQKIDLIFRSDN